ncbi:Metallo-dependent phosphatase [Athelia psychrophila]|uniref:Serine/threonine-protein phosphatase n=1 Tax=Athelia psychrophila TaxID=1759441 RepID=A0A166A6Y2_9AGAM|nr:Metallo-dependent phosphatase [Fibularhizoctonia sp. CBS 109695]
MCTGSPTSNRYPKRRAGVRRGCARAHAQRELLGAHVFWEGRLTESQALQILDQATQVLSAEPNLVYVANPVTSASPLVGVPPGRYDLMKLFGVGGTLDGNAYLFLGDYVDPGCFGIECLPYLYTLKLWYPKKSTLLRGNHECKHLTGYFTFKREYLHKYSALVYETCIKSFCSLPITTLVDGRFLCVHSGVSPKLGTSDDFRRLNCSLGPGSHGLLCDLL